jgi:hypothetical protein
MGRMMGLQTSSAAEAEVRAMAGERWEIIADFVEPCSYCGAPCTGTVRVWYIDQGRRVAFETDRGSLSEPLRELVGAAIERGEYDALPSFAREWNEARGWAEFASDGAPVAADDMLRAVDALDRRRPAEDVRGGAMLAGLRAFVSQAAGEGREVWVAET